MTHPSCSAERRRCCLSPAPPPTPVSRLQWAGHQAVITDSMLLQTRAYTPVLLFKENKNWTIYCCKHTVLFSYTSSTTCSYSRTMLYNCPLLNYCLLTDVASTGVDGGQHPALRGHHQPLAALPSLVHRQIAHWTHKLLVPVEIDWVSNVARLGFQALWCSWVRPHIRLVAHF